MEICEECLNIARTVEILRNFLNIMNTVGIQRTMLKYYILNWNNVNSVGIKRARLEYRIAPILSGKSSIETLTIAKLCISLILLCK